MTVRMKWNFGALRELRSTPQAVEEVRRRANRVKSRAESIDGGKYVVKAGVGAARPDGRARASVTTGDPRTIRKNAKRHTLLRSLDAGR